MPPEEDTKQSVTESQTPAIEAPAPAAEPATVSETPLSPAEVSPATDSTHSTGSTGSPQASSGQESSPQSETAPAEATAHIPVHEPLAPEPEPLEAIPKPPAQQSFARDFLAKARISIQDRRRKKRDKIMQALNTKNKITNDEVEKLLHVSDATATRYLSALEREGKLQQVGKIGSGVAYQKI